VNYRDYGLFITRSVLGFNYGANATGGPTFTQGAPTAVGVVTMNGSGENVDITTQTKHYTLKYRHRGDLWRWDMNGAASGLRLRPPRHRLRLLQPRARHAHRRRPPR
jgi:hypothetical protein